MYILSGSKREIVKADYAERFCIVEKPDAVLLVLSYGPNRPTVTLARYADVKEASDAFLKLYSALAEERPFFDMPESLRYAEERIVKDARTKRRGGS